ncbi:ATP-binding protein [Nonomuraea typhae]|uniref:ATP-binding protein n=1 Tax=Nonomuraea typhae TaxID=2603600 RepID=UPI0012FC7BC2|nr:ATP-binding protein [Nonomuraea typhae]
MTAPAKGRNVFSWTLEQGPQEIGRARNEVRKALVSYELPNDLLDDTVLVFSELVTNAVQHGSGPIEFVVHVLFDRIRLCVADASPRPLVPVQPGSHDERGRGLAIVASCSTRWWVCTRHPGKEVWAEFRRPATVLPSWLLAGVPGYTGEGRDLPTSIFTQGH